MSDQRILVLGIGNPLVGDEGVGVRVAEELMGRWDFPENVTVMDAGTMGMSMLGLLSDHDLAIVVDALDGTGEPAGTVMRMDPADLAPNQVLHSLHDVRLADVLEAASFAGIAPAVEFVGIQIARMETMVTDLSPAVEAAVHKAVDTVLEMLAHHGVSFQTADTASPDARAIRSIRTRETMRGEPDGS